VPAARIGTDGANAEYAGNDEHRHHPPEAADDVADADDDARGQRQVSTKADEEVGEDRHDLPHQEADDEDGDADDGDRVDQGRTDGSLELDVLFDIGCKALQDGVENTAGFARVDHVDHKVVEDLGIAAHGVAQGRAAFHGGADAGERLLEGLGFLVGGQDFKALHEGQAGVDHDRELPEENGNVLGLDFAAASQHGQSELLAFLLDGDRLDAFAAQ